MTQVELEKLELERSAMLQELVVRQRDELIHRARRQLRVRDLIIAAQQELLEQHGLRVGPHIESLFGRLEPTDEIFDESQYAARNPIRVGADAVSNGPEEVVGTTNKSSNPNSSSSALATWAIKQAVYPVSKIDDIVTVDLAKSLQVSTSENRDDDANKTSTSASRSRGGSSAVPLAESKSKDKRRPHQHFVAPVPIDAPAPGRHQRRSGGGGNSRRHRSSSRDRPKVNRSRSQMQMHRDSGRPAPGAPYRQGAPSARELERAKRRVDRGGGAGGRQQRERMVVWEEGKSAVVKDRLDDVRAMIGANAGRVGISSSSSHLNERENRDDWDMDMHKKRGVASDGRHKRRTGRPRRMDSHGTMDDQAVGLNTGWAERLKMYLKTPRSRFSRNKPGRSRSKSPSKRGGSEPADAVGSKDPGKLPNPSSDPKSKISQNLRRQPSAPRSSSSSNRLTTSASISTAPHTPEGKCAPDLEPSIDGDVVEGKTFFVSPASAPSATTCTALSTTFSPTTLKAESISMTVKDADDFRLKGSSGSVMCPTPNSPDKFHGGRNDENVHNSSSLGRKMTPLPNIEKKDQRRFSSSPVPLNTISSTSGGGMFGVGVDEGRRVLSLVNRKKKRRGGPVTSRPFWGKPRPSIPSVSQ